MSDASIATPAEPALSTVPDPHPPRNGHRVDPITRARRNPTSRKLAIAAKCYDCQGRDDDPGVRERIRTCLSPGCPLYPVRPYKDSRAAEAARLEALAERAAKLRAMGVR